MMGKSQKIYKGLKEKQQQQQQTKNHQKDECTHRPEKQKLTLNYYLNFNHRLTLMF